MGRIGGNGSRTNGNTHFRVPIRDFVFGRVPLRFRAAAAARNRWRVPRASPRRLAAPLRLSIIIAHCAGELGSAQKEIELPPQQQRERASPLPNPIQYLGMKSSTVSYTHLRAHET